MLSTTSKYFPILDPILKNSSGFDSFFELGIILAFVFTKLSTLD